MKVLIPFAIGVYLWWSPVYYFQDKQTTNKVETHTGCWFDGTGWRPGDSQ
jgi:hypothetical protein